MPGTATPLRRAGRRGSGLRAARTRREPGRSARIARPGRAAPASTRPRPLAVPPLPALSACARPGCDGLPPPALRGPARPGPPARGAPHSPRASVAAAANGGSRGTVRPPRRTHRRALLPRLVSVTPADPAAPLPRAAGNVRRHGAGPHRYAPSPPGTATPLRRATGRPGRRCWA